MSTLWLNTASGDLLNSDYVARIYETDGRIMAQLADDTEASDIQLAMKSLMEVRDRLTKCKPVV